MSSSIKEFEHLKFSLEELKLATKDFTDCIGKGGFGKVYKGELLLSTGLTLVAVKRLNSKLGQGAPEFWREIMLLSRYKHENLVSLLGFCDEGREMILVYEYLPNKSLDLYLSSTDLSWTQRLRICIGAARGLQYLHEPAEGTQQRVLHRDIKSANILLDQNWKAKIADFGLSKFGPANQHFTFLFSNAVGTIGYCDPLYVQTGFLTKESDIYSFGAVLFEVLCGRRCVQIIYDNIRRFLPVLARKCYDEKILDTIVDNSLKAQISPKCLERFSKIAYQCLLINRTERPLVTDVVKELEIALEYQMDFEFEKGKELKRNLASESDSNEYWETKLPREWEVIVRNFNIPSSIYTIRKKLFSHLHDGILFDEGNKFFTINKDGKKCVLISATRFLELDGNNNSWVFQRDYLRFPRVADISLLFGTRLDMRCRIKTSMLSLGTMYAANLVFKFDNADPNSTLKHVELVRIKWKTEELSVSSLHHAELTSDNWYKITMWRFINHGPNADFDIVLEQLSYPKDCFSANRPSLMIQGIEFQPTTNMASFSFLKQEDFKGFKNVTITDEEDIDDDEYWEKKLPYNYRYYTEMSDTPLDYTTKKELYHRFSEGFLGKRGYLWISIHETSDGVRSMQPATDILCDRHHKPPETLYLTESRLLISVLHAFAIRDGDIRSVFKKVTKLGESEWFSIKCKPWLSMSRQYNYICYLVFKFEDNHDQPHHDTSLFKSDYRLDGNYQGTMYGCLSMYSLINIPTIKPKNDYVWHDDSSSSIPSMERHIENLGDNNCIKERIDGWLEVMLSKPLDSSVYSELLELNLRKEDGLFPGMIVEGIEFRPCI